MPAMFICSRVARRSSRSVSHVTSYGHVLQRKRFGEGVSWFDSRTSEAHFVSSRRSLIYDALRSTRDVIRVRPPSKIFQLTRVLSVSGFMVCSAFTIARRSLRLLSSAVGHETSKRHRTPGARSHSTHPNCVLPSCRSSLPLKAMCGGQLFVLYYRSFMLSAGTGSRCLARHATGVILRPLACPGRCF